MDQTYEESLRRVMLRLSRGDLTEAEARRLTGRDDVVEHLREKRLLNDHRVAEALIHRWSGRNMRGRTWLQSEFERRDIPSHIAGPLLENLPSDFDRANELLGLVRKPDAVRKARFLASRGFAEEVIDSVLGDSLREASDWRHN